MKKNDSIHIEHPEAWELSVAIGDGRVDYILYTPTVANSLIIDSIARPDRTLQGLEDVIYDTPVLLNEYKRVRVVVHSRHFVLFPGETDDEDCISLLRHAFPDNEGEPAVYLLPLNEVKICYFIPRGLQAFLGRTFNYPILYHHLYPLCEHIKGLTHGDDRLRMFLNLKEESMDIAVYGMGKLQCANSFTFSSIHDAKYYALNAWRAHGLDQLTDELLLMGDPEACAALTPELREFVKSVMPAACPAAAMRLGRNAMQAPLELILMALCE